MTITNRDRRAGHESGVPAPSVSRPLQPPLRAAARPVRRTLGVLGRAMIATGVLILLFVAYQLWGTGLREARSQQELRAGFEQQAATVTPSRAAADDEPQAPPEQEPAGTPEPITAAPPSTATAPPAAGQAFGIIQIPKLGIDKVVVEGTDTRALQKGPGHQPGTVLPGEPGNAVIAGHRTTYGAPFSRLDELAAGDAIVVRTSAGEFHYTVTGSQVVEPTDVWILDPTPDDRLTLFTCTPKFSAARRLVVTAQLASPPDPRPSPAPTAPPAASQRPDADDPAPRLAEPVTELAAVSGSVPAAVGWAAAALLTALGIWWAGRRYRRSVAYPIGAPIFAVALFITFERVAALLPAAV